MTYVYDPSTDSWSTMASIPVPVEFYASAVIDIKIYIIGGGTTISGDGNALNLVQIFDPSKNQWTYGTPIPTGVFAPGSCATTGLSAPERIYVVGGSLAYSAPIYFDASAATETNLTQVYDPATGIWSYATPLPFNNSYLLLENVGDNLYELGGTPGQNIGRVTVEKYIPSGYSPPTPSPSPTLSPTSSPPIPELSWLAILPLLLSMFSVAVVLRYRNQVKKIYE